MPVVRQSLLASIRHYQQKLQDNHERSKTVTRSADMKVIREHMQARRRMRHLLSFHSAAAACVSVRVCCRPDAADWMGYTCHCMTVRGSATLPRRQVGNLNIC